MSRSKVPLLPKPRPGTETKGGLGHNHDAECLQRVVRTCRRLLEPMRQKRREATAVSSEWGRGVHLWRLSSTVCGWFLIYGLCFVADSQSRWGRSGEKRPRWPVSGEEALICESSTVCRWFLIYRFCPTFCFIGTKIRQLQTQNRESKANNQQVYVENCLKIPIDIFTEQFEVLLNVWLYLSI